MLLPALAAAKRKAQKINCTNNLKQVGLAFRIWEGDNGDRYSMAVQAANGGANEYLDHANGGSITVAPNGLIPGMAFMVMSNELSTAKILFCPSDNIHTAGNGYATNFSYSDLLGEAANYTPPASPGKVTVPPTSTPGKISYFINGDATEANPQDVMTGDENIGNTAATAANAAATYAFTQTGAGAAPSNGSKGEQILPVAFGSANGAFAWTANDFHQKVGNIGMADGSCQSATIVTLHQYLSNSTNSAEEVLNFQE